MAPPPADAPPSAAAVPAAAGLGQRPAGRRGRLDPALRNRIAAGMFLGLLATGDVLLGGWFFALLLLGAVALMSREWARLAGPLDPAARDLVMGAALLPAAAILLAMSSGEGGGALLLLAVGSVAAAGVAALLPGAPSHWAAGGVLYVGLPALSLLWLRNDGPHGIVLVLWLFFVVWATDTFAYFAGRAVGGPRLAPKLSPSKTWAGLAGGMVGAVAVGGPSPRPRAGRRSAARAGGRCSRPWPRPATCSSPGSSAGPG
jgi:phosphatidate cytidylyltransferase